METNERPEGQEQALAPAINQYKETSNLVSTEEQAD